MESFLTKWADKILAWLGLGDSPDSWDRWLAFALAVAAVLLLEYLVRRFVVRGVRHIVERTRVTWDDQIVTPTILMRGFQIFTAILLMSVTPIIFRGHNAFIIRLVDSYFTFAVIRFLYSLLEVMFEVVSLRPAWENKPIKGLRQTAQGVVMIIGAILIISIMIDKSPTILLTGLGASAAVIMLIFKDSILGFVSGIQLSANDMVQVGDWISMPKYGADGTVEEVTLTTVKIRNFDKTIVTLPPYLLVSESFQNWRGMQLSGGRRVMRSISIDMSGVKFLSPDELASFAGIGLLADHIAELGRNGEAPTNLGLFRAYLELYIRKKVPVNPDMMVMVRQLQPTETGLPMQLYFFTNTVIWTEYEKIQADVFDHVLAIIPTFGLRVFQSPSGSDITAITEK